MYTMKEVCNEVSLPYETLKFYCNKGLVPNVKRDKNNYRVFDDNDLEWLKNLSCLKNCGMTLNDMKVYIDLCMEGESSIPQRKEILLIKREKLVSQIDELQNSIDYIDKKEQFYNDVLDGKVDYFSNLINTDN